MACTFNEKEPWDVHSLALLTNDNCLPLLDTYSVRIHEAIKRGTHFDIAIGTFDLDLCVDFVIFGTLTPDELARGDNFPIPGQYKWMNFMPAHNAHDFKDAAGNTHPGVIFSRLGVWNTIPAGEYGGGKWKISRTGPASVQRVSAHSYIMEIDGVIYKTFKPPNFDNFKVLRTK